MDRDVVIEHGKIQFYSLNTGLQLCNHKHHLGHDIGYWSFVILVLLNVHRSLMYVVLQIPSHIHAITPAYMDISERQDNEIAQEIQEELVRQAEQQRQQEEKDAVSKTSSHGFCHSRTM